MHRSRWLNVALALMAYPLINLEAILSSNTTFHFLLLVLRPMTYLNLIKLNRQDHMKGNFSFQLSWILACHHNLHHSFMVSIRIATHSGQSTNEILLIIDRIKMSPKLTLLLQEQVSLPWCLA